MNMTQEDKWNTQKATGSIILRHDVDHGVAGVGASGGGSGESALPGIVPGVRHFVRYDGSDPMNPQMSASRSRVW